MDTVERVNGTPKRSAARAARISPSAPVQPREPGRRKRHGHGHLLPDHRRVSPAAVNVHRHALAKTDLLEVRAVGAQRGPRRRRPGPRSRRPSAQLAVVPIRRRSSIFVMTAMTPFTRRSGFDGPRTVGVQSLHDPAGTGGACPSRNARRPGCCARRSRRTRSTQRCAKRRAPHRGIEEPGFAPGVLKVPSSVRFETSGAEKAPLMSPAAGPWFPRFPGSGPPPGHPAPPTRDRQGPS